MRIKCINNIGDWEDTVRLTVGKTYNVEEIRTDGYLIKNDDETLACYYKYRFEEVKEMEKEKVLEVEFQDDFDKVYELFEIKRELENKNSISLKSLDRLYEIGLNSCEETLTLIRGSK